MKTLFGAVFTVDVVGEVAEILPASVTENSLKDIDVRDKGHSRSFSFSVIQSTNMVYKVSLPYIQ